MVKRVVNHVEVVDVEKRRFPSKHYVYVVNVTWSDGSQTVIYRRYSRFFEFQVQLLELFPEEGGDNDPAQRMIPFLPGKIIFGRSHIREVAVKRLSSIDTYCKALVRLPAHISESFDVLQFFQVEEEDLNPIRDDKDKRKVQAVGDVISEPMLLEQYVAIADYKKKQKNEVTLKAGAGVEVVEKNENGWWFVNVEEEQGWVPASYLEPADGGAVPKESNAVAKPGEEEKFVTVQEYKAENRDELSFEKGVVVEVVQKNLEGWWKVRYQGKEGVVPAAYLQYMSARPVVSGGDSMAGQVQMVSTASAAVSDTIKKQQPSEDGSSAGKEAKKEAKKLAIPVTGSMSGNSGVIPPRRQSIKVTKKMRSQTRGKESGVGGAAAAAAAAVALSGVQEEETAPRKASTSNFPSMSPSNGSDRIVTVTCNYKAVGDSELSVRDGDEVEVIERNESGWWFVKRRGKQGWVPSSSFDVGNADVETSSRSVSPTSQLVGNDEVVYMTVGDFKASADDGISFSANQRVQVLEKAANGWWFVVIDGHEGWAPSSYIEKSTVKGGPSSSVSLSSSSAAAPAAKPSTVSPAIDISKVSLKPTKPSGAKQQPSSGSVSTSPLSNGSSADDGLKSELSKVALKSSKAAGDRKTFSSPKIPSEDSNGVPAAGHKPTKSVSPSALKPGGGSAAAGSDLGRVALKPVKGGGKSPAKATDITNSAASSTNRDPKPVNPSGVQKSSNKPDSSKGPTLPSKSPKLPAKVPATAEPQSSMVKPALKPVVPAPAAVASAKKEEKLKPPAAPARPMSVGKKPTKDGKPAAVISKTSGAYVAIGDYTADEAESLTFKEGTTLELVEKNDTGWWLMRLENGKEGWAPSTYFKEATSTPLSVCNERAAGGGSVTALLSKMHEAKQNKTTPDGGGGDKAGPKVADAPKPKRTGPPIPRLPSATPSRASVSKAAGQVKTSGSTSKSDVPSASARPGAMKPPARPDSRPVSKVIEPKASKTSVSKPSATLPSDDGNQYTATADYTADGADEISLRGGERVTVLDKNDTGWWCVRVRGKEGWAPSTYLAKTVKSGSSKPAQLKPLARKAASNRATASYEGEEGEVSFKKGDSLEVLEKADTGWWFVRTGSGEEGWAPSTYIE